MDEDISKQMVSQCACFWVRAAARRLTRDYDEALQPLGLKMTQFSVLSIIKFSQPKSITNMASMMAMERTSLVRTLNLLEKNGYVLLGQEGYRREREMKLTKAGEKIYQKALPLWEAVQTTFKARLDDDEWERNIPFIKDMAFGPFDKKATQD